MIKYCYDEPTEHGNRRVCKTIDEIREEYYPFWTAKVIEVKGEAVANSLTFDDCLVEWIDYHWAFEVDTI